MRYCAGARDVAHPGRRRGRLDRRVTASLGDHAQSRIGLGLKRPADVARVEEAAAHYRAAGAQRFFLHVHPDAKRHGLDSACANAGLCKGRGWQKFERGVYEPIPAEEPDLQIREAGRDDAPAFGRIIADAFDLGDAAAPWIARHPSAPGWRAFVALVEGDPAGTGALFIRNGHAWTDFGATAPPFRRRGVQRSLLAHRVREALAAGCVRIHTCTGEDVPGDPQHSYANIERCGFRESYVRGQGLAVGTTSCRPVNPFLEARTDDREVPFGEPNATRR